MNPAHPPVKCFFYMNMNVYSYDLIFGAEFALKSRGFGGFSGFGKLSGEDESVKCFVSITGTFEPANFIDF